MICQKCIPLKDMYFKKKNNKTETQSCKKNKLKKTKNKDPGCLVTLLREQVSKF